MKLKSLIILNLMLCSIAYSQTKKESKFSMGLGASYGFPLSQFFSKDFKNPVGGNLKLDYKATKLGFVTFSLTSLTGKAKGIGYGSYDLLLIDFGYKTKLKNSNIYVESGAGLETFSGTNPLVYVSSGYIVPISKKSAIDIFARLNYIFSSGLSTMLNFNVNYKYSF